MPDTDDDVAELDHLSFTPPACTKVIDESKLPKEMSLTDMLTFLEENGLPSGHDEAKVTFFKRSAGLNVTGLSPGICKTLIESLHEKFVEPFDRKLYCNGVVNIESSSEMSSQSAPVHKLNGNNLSSSIPVLNETGGKPPNKVKKASPRGLVATVKDGNDSSGDEGSDSDNSVSTKIR